MLIFMFMHIHTDACSSDAAGFIKSVFLTFDSSSKNLTELSEHPFQVVFKNTSVTISYGEHYMKGKNLKAVAKRPKTIGFNFTIKQQDS